MLPARQVPHRSAAVSGAADKVCVLQDDGPSMWSRHFNFGGKEVRVEEGWGVGIGESCLCTQFATWAAAFVIVSFLFRGHCMGRWGPVSTVLEVEIYTYNLSSLPS